MKHEALLIALACMVGLSLTAPAWAQLQNENLLETMPKGFKVGFQTSHNGMHMQEWVPQGETVENWSEMITTQVFLNMGHGPVTPAQFLKGIGDQWFSACKDAWTQPLMPGNPADIVNGHANGYAMSMMFLRCPLNSQTNKPENTIIRITKGNDSMYVIQKAFKFEPTHEQFISSMQYMATVQVCDTRTKEHPCPDLKAEGFKLLQKQ